MSTVLPPSYSLADIPSYTAHPRGDEQTLGLAARERRASRVGNWTKKVGHATLTLTGQTPNSELPVYGRNTVVQGFLTLDSPEDVANVQLKLHGHVKCKTIAEIGRSDVTVLSTTVLLWANGGTRSLCPAQLPFEVHLPTTYTWKDHTGPLPPTFEYTFYDLQGGTPGLMAKIKYEVSVEVEHTHPTLKDRLAATLSTPFIYLPRSRPGRPLSSSPTSVFDAVMEHRAGGKSREIDPIVWKLRLPPPGTYAITQPVPFRVSVTSRSSALLAPFAPTTKKDKASIRVYMLRQVSIKVNTIDLWRSYVIAEGSLKYDPQNLDGGMWLKNRPPSPNGEKASSLGSGGSATSFSEREGWASHDWSGELKIDREQITGGGFAVGDMKVKDFIVLSVVPPNPDSGDLLEVKRVVPIQLTTDSWEGAGHTPPTAPIEAHAETNLESNGYLEGRGEGHHVHPNGTNDHGEHRNGHGTTPAY
ncbi:hypothetical protein JB92DRAFT_3115384 [Gautieria morchelliformis]|nr:hypothetical protein JB92DRAFT_3115384 [Gautieria morchelliformis]